MKSKSNNIHAEVAEVKQITIDMRRFDAEPADNDLPILATRNLVLFPGVTIPISLGRENSIVTASLASERHIPIGIVCQRDPEDETPSVTVGLFKYGVIADVLKTFELPDGSHTALVQARGRFRITGKGKGLTIPEAKLSAKVKLLPENKPDDEEEFNTLVELVMQTATKLVKDSMENSGDFLLDLKQNNVGAQAIVNFLCTNLPFDPAAKAKMLSKANISERAYELMAQLSASEAKLEITRDIVQRTRQSMDQNQRNAFLQQQMETIREELYGDGDDVENLAARAADVDFPETVRATVDKEIDKMRRLNPQSPDYALQYSYLDTLISLPWNENTAATPTFADARSILQADHYGLEKVKQRILEQLALMLHNPNGKSPIICLVGPPGVGKTSLGKSVARALGRNYQRVSFGGLHDEAEIRGHRRTYIGAMPGRIIDAMKRAGASDPVLLLDEIDKIGKDFKGDPAAALLEVLDPEQNCHFHDNYIDVDFDLSHVLFIATANSLSNIDRPLLDRMEVIDLSGYIPDEKLHIAKEHLIPDIRNEYNVGDDIFAVSDDAIKGVIEEYTSESGVRQLRKQLASLARKAILAAQSNEGEFPHPVEPGDLRALLGMPLYNKECYEGNELAGVVTGLAWTQVGGEILLAEASLSPGKGDRLSITGNLGDVMKESATIALQWVKAHCDSLDIEPSMFERYNLHIHFPEGAIPKDGPSAGITIATAIVSAFTGRRVAERLAMTGEITLRGRVLPVGGIKEKILAAQRAGITTVILSQQNRKDIEDIPAAYLEGMEFIYVDTVDQVIAHAITDVPAVDARKA